MGTWDKRVMSDNEYPNVYTSEGTSASTLTALLHCTFKPDKRIIELEDRLLQYYDETKDCDNKYAMKRWKAFSNWAIGYTRDEINSAKKNVLGRADI
jgi:hypothetical protein